MSNRNHLPYQSRAIGAGERVSRKPIVGKPYKFNTLNQYLRQGLTPEELGGEILGQGVCKAAYKFNIIDRMNGVVTPYVIKRNAQGGWDGDSEKFPVELVKAGAIPVKSTRIGKYVMQEYITPFASARNQGIAIPAKAREQQRKVHENLRAAKLHFDIHDANCGFNANGDYRIFDW